MAARVQLKQVVQENTNGSAPVRMGLMGPIEDKFVEDSKEFLSVKEMSELFGVEPMTIWYWRKNAKTKNKLPVLQVKKGERHNVRFRLEDVVKWADENQVWYKRDSELIKARASA
jgi:hypothetical protein